MLKKGISVCIPVYRYPVQGLLNWIKNYPPSFDFEVLLYLDGKDHPDIELEGLPAKIISANGLRVGVSLARKALVEAAQFDYLLFLDADVIPLNGAYLSIMEHFKHKAQVVVGGYAYFKIDFEKGRRLRFYYGKSREEAHANKRNQFPFQRIFLGNFLIRKEIILEILKNWPGVFYGHEDTLVGYRLENLGIKPMHIENPVRHIPTDTNELFLEKTKEATECLVLLEGSYPEMRQTKLGKFALRLPFKPLLIFGLNLIQDSLVKHLIYADRPIIEVLDLLKLLWYLEAKKDYSKTI